MQLIDIDTSALSPGAVTVHEAPATSQDPIEQRIDINEPVRIIVLPHPDGPEGGREKQVIATVLGKMVTRGDLHWEQLDALTGAILSPLLEQFQKEQGLVAEDAEIEQLAAAMSETLVPDRNDAPDREMWREIAQQFVLNWKTSRALYQHYGGTVIFQQSNPLEPVGAYCSFLREQEKKGAFRIHDPIQQKRFWDYFTRDHGPSVVPPDKVDYSTPWWLKKDGE
jgi:hypothetical protein